MIHHSAPRKTKGEIEEKETIEDVIEPFLIQQGFIQRTPRGRIVSPAAYKHFGFDLPESN